MIKVKLEMKSKKERMPLFNIESDRGIILCIMTEDQLKETAIVPFRKKLFDEYIPQLIRKDRVEIYSKHLINGKETNCIIKLWHMSYVENKH